MQTPDGSSFFQERLVWFCSKASRDFDKTAHRGNDNKPGDNGKAKTAITNSN